MSQYFTHDEMAQAISHLFPELTHGKDYLVLMGIAADGTPASNAWIERWPVDTEMPTMDELHDAYQAALLAPAPAPPPQTSTTPLEFYERFTEEEQLAVVAATMQSPVVKRWYDKLMAASEVVYADTRLAAGLDSLVAAGLITQARSEEILPLAVRTTGMQAL